MIFYSSTKYILGFTDDSVVKNPPANTRDRFNPWVRKEVATHSSIPAWEIPWKEESGGLQSTVSQKSDMT